MTSGLINLGNAYAASKMYRAWNGTNGKYTVVNGRKVIKYNDYTLEVVRQFGGRATYMNAYINCLGTPNPSDIWKSYDDLMLQSKLVQKIKGHGFNMAVALGEGHKTVSMVKSNLQSIGKAFLAAKSGNLVAALNFLGTGQTNQRKRSFTSKDVGSRWLELQYGWLPLLSDVYESAKAFEKLSQAPRITKVSVFKTKEKPWNGSQSPANWYGYGKYRFIKKLTYEMTEDLSASRSLGLLDPLSLTWELLPYSFVVDWFIPIGTYLENLNVIPKLTGRTTTSTLLVTKCNGVGIPRPPPNSYIGAWCNSYTASYYRTISSGLHTVRPSFKVLSAALSSKHIWNAIALARQRMSP